MVSNAFPFDRKSSVSSVPPSTTRFVSLSNGRAGSVAKRLVAIGLRATSLKRGLLINFGELRLVDGIKRISL